MAICFFACNQRTPLEAEIAKGIASGERYDSLFLGVKLGMERKEFYDHCWDLNRREIVKEGATNNSVLYFFDDSQGNQIEFNFYPEFIDGVAYTYNTSFNYYAWAPWNKQLQSQNMIEFLPELFNEWYGDAPIIQEAKDREIIYYRIDGNRKIEMRIADERYVFATFTDMTFPKTNE